MTAEAIRTTATDDRGRWQRLRNAPLVLQVYLCFVAVVPVLSLVLAFIPPINSHIVPYTGWAGAFLYANTFYFVFAAIVHGPRKAVYAAPGMIGLFLGFGVIELIQHLWVEYRDFGNPYLEFNPLRPVFTIAFPAGWILLLLSPSVRRWVRERTRRLQASAQSVLLVRLAVHGVDRGGVHGDFRAIGRAGAKASGAKTAILVARQAIDSGLSAFDILTRRASEASTRGVPFADNSSFGRVRVGGCRARASG